MKKIIALCFTALLISITGFPQDKGYIGLSLGPGFPSGEFAGTDATNGSSGYAVTGLKYDVSLGYKPGKYLGVSAFICRQTNPIDTRAFTKNVAMVNSIDNISVKSNNWNFSSYMLGGYLSAPLQNNLEFESRILLGFMSTRSPEINVNFYESGQPSRVKMHELSTLSFSWMLGAGFRYNASNRICILLNFDYLASKPEFHGYVTGSDAGLIRLDGYRMKLESLSLSAGIGYRF